MIKTEFLRNGVSGRYIRLETSASRRGIYGRIGYEGVIEPVSTDGFHEAIVVRVGGKDIVYDNLNPRGIAYDAWQKKFDVFPGGGNKLQIVKDEAFSP